MKVSAVQHNDAQYSAVLDTANDQVEGLVSRERWWLCILYTVLYTVHYSVHFSLHVTLLTTLYTALYTVHCSVHTIVSRLHFFKNFFPSGKCITKWEA